uniref:Metalloendopeptidase n=1 Tax=Parastrongyloides trichosuri TaxID=131310 RepID=A0A0N4Z5N6_PARTI
MIKNENGINVVEPNFIYIGHSCNNKGHVLSFILQVLGVDDEHNRIDRDKYVKIRDEKMEPRFREYFQKDNIKNTKIFDTNYDYGSITHGSPRLYLRWAGGETIKVIGNHTEYYQKMIGQRYSVSFNEYKLVNYLYCNETCKSTEKKPECWFGGYQNPNKCNECLCPYPLYGYRCQSLTSDNKGYCPYTSVSPAPYETLLKYYGYRHCSTIIQAPEKHQRIQII